MMEDLWATLCGSSECSYEVGKRCSSGLLAVFHPYSCTNHLFVISIDILLLIISLSIILNKSSTSKIVAPQSYRCYMPLPIWSAIFNWGLGLVYVGLGILIIQHELRSEHTIVPLHGWLVVLFQGFTWLVLGIVSFRQRCPPAITLKFFSVLLFLFATFPSISSFVEVIIDSETSLKDVLDILSLPGAILLLLCVFREKKYRETVIGIKEGTLYTPLRGEEAGAGSEISLDENVTPFSNAGFLSRMFFWWLNPLMKKGKMKVLGDKDIPKLRQADRAEMCYSLFMEQLTIQNEKGTSEAPSILSTIFFWQLKAILISGFFALIKVLALATSPLLLWAFIRLAQGKQAFKYEGYALAGGLFLAKCLESLSERQWNFRTRLIGLQVRSLLSAAIYQKQLRLSNTAKTTHSSGQIMNYVIVDAYRIGEFLYWLHHIWATSLQLCLSLVIIYYSIGLATIAALLVVILTVAGNSPMAKLQHTCMTKLMVTQDRRLKAITEAVTNMKILKLYAWETHFMKVIEGLRKEESTWLSAVLSQRGYNLVLFWSSTIIVSIVTFWACHFLGIPLYTSTVFTFLATLRIIQEPISLLPDVVGVFIEAKVALTRIVKFLEEPELQNKSVKSQGKEFERSISIKAGKFSWDGNSSKTTLENINLVIKPGEKVAICGEVGSGKSTLLAAILGEVPNINGMVSL